MERKRECSVCVRADVSLSLAAATLDEEGASPSLDHPENPPHPRRPSLTPLHPALTLIPVRINSA